MLYMFERMIQNQSIQQFEFVIIADCNGFGYSSIPSFSLMKEWADMMSKHFPKRMGLVFNNLITFV